MMNGKSARFCFVGSTLNLFISRLIIWYAISSAVTARAYIQAGPIANDSGAFASFNPFYFSDVLYLAIL